MALLFCDGFDSYTQVSDMASKGWVGAAGNIVIPSYFSWVSNAGAFGGGALVVANCDSTAQAYIPNLFTYAEGYTLCAAMSYKQGQAPSAPSNQGGFFVLGYDQATAGGGDAYSVLTLNAAGKIVFLPFGATAPVATTGSVNLCDGVFHWVEIEMVMSSASVGSITVVVDGVTDLQLTNISTIADPNTLPTGHVGVGAANNNGSISCTSTIDDVIFWDTTGSAYNNFPRGQKRIALATPNAAGADAQFTASAGANYAVAAQPYSGSAKLTATSASLVDLYGTTGLNGVNPATIDAVVHNVFASNPANGTRKVQGIIQTGGVNSQTPAVQLTSVAKNFQTPHYTDANGNAWTTTTVNAMQLGLGSA